MKGNTKRHSVAHTRPLLLSHFHPFAMNASVGQPALLTIAGNSGTHDGVGGG